MVSVADVKGAMPQYQGLTDAQIEKAILMAERYLDGASRDWRSLTNAEGESIAEDAHLLASVMYTLKLHFPSNVDQYQSLKEDIVEMVNSTWSSSLMIRKKTGFFKVIPPYNP